MKIVRPAPTPEYMIQQESHKGRLIETSGKIPASTRNPAAKVHYIVRFRDWRLTHSVTLALDVPKMYLFTYARMTPSHNNNVHNPIPV